MGDSYQGEKNDLKGIELEIVGRMFTATDCRQTGNWRQGNRSYLWFKVIDNVISY